MAPKPQNHKIMNFKNVPNGFPIPEYPNKHRICIYKKYSLSINAKYKLAFFFFGLLGNKFSRILSRPWFESLSGVHAANGLRIGQTYSFIMTLLIRVSQNT